MCANISFEVALVRGIMEWAVSHERGLNLILYRGKVAFRMCMY